MRCGAKLRHSRLCQAERARIDPDGECEHQRSGVSPIAVGMEDDRGVKSEVDSRRIGPGNGFDLRSVWGRDRGPECPVKKRAQRGRCHSDVAGLVQKVARPTQR